MAEYFCYISESKVDDLLAQVDEYTVTSISEEHARESERAGNAGLSDILGLFSFGARFGKKDRIVISEVKHHSIIQKLKLVVSYLISTTNLSDLGIEVQSGRLDSVYYSFEGRFTVVKQDEDFVHLESHVSSAVTLELVCSLKYFSDMGREGDRYIPHSGNWAFFSGITTPIFKTVVVVQDFKDNHVLGSPLYLALQPIRELNL